LQLWRSASLSRCPLHPKGGCGFARHGIYATLSGQRSRFTPEEQRPFIEISCTNRRDVAVEIVALTGNLFEKLELN
jgi:hypothetical protein